MAPARAIRSATPWGASRGPCGLPPNVALRAGMIGLVLGSTPAAAEIPCRDCSTWWDIPPECCVSAATAHVTNSKNKGQFHDEYVLRTEGVPWLFHDEYAQRLRNVHSV